MAFTQFDTNELKLHFKDANGKPSTSQYQVASTETDPAAGGALAIANAAQGLSNAALERTEIIVGATNDSPGTPGSTAYGRGADKGLLVFRTGSGKTINLQIGSPLALMFGTDAQTVNKAQAAVADLISTMLTAACDESGDDLTAYQRGYRRRPPNRKHA